MKNHAIGMRTALAAAMVLAVGIAAFPGCEKKQSPPPAPTKPAEMPKPADAPKPPG